MFRSVSRTTHGSVKHKSNMNYSTSSALTENATLEANNPTRIDMPAHTSETPPSSNQSHSQPLTNNKNLLKWIEKMAALTQPAVIHWVDGSQAEYETLCAEMVAGGTFIKLNEKLWPGCYYAKSDPSDVARVEDRTYICSLSKDNAGPTNNWVDPFEMRQKNSKRFSMAACADAPCMYFPFPWDRSAHHCLRSASNLPTRRTRWSTCASWLESACQSLRRSTRTPNVSYLAFTP